MTALARGSLDERMGTISPMEIRRIYEAVSEPV